MRSYNDWVIVEPYKGAKKLETKVTSGFATIKQKSTLIGLTVLVDNVYFKKGEKVYFTEEELTSSSWSRKELECDAIDGKFIMAPKTSVIVGG